MEYVRWADSPLQSLDANWQDTDYVKEQQAYQSGPGDTHTLQNKVQLSTYANHIGEDLHDLYHFLSTRLQGAAWLPGLRLPAVGALWRVLQYGWSTWHAQHSDR